jgi:hypothetical protein
MSILCDKEIKDFALNQDMIKPFHDSLVNKKDNKKLLSYVLVHMDMIFVCLQNNV